MLSTGEELHPNWRALATIHLPLKRFIKASDRSESFVPATSDRRDKTNDTFQGSEAKEFYEEVLAERGTTTTLRSNRSKCIKNSIATVQEVEKKLSFDRHKFFLFAQQNNAESLKKIEVNSDEINCRDEFGWTALMVAACEGATEVVKTLLQLGADKTLKDKAQNTALDLARKKGHSTIVKILENDSTIFRIEGRANFQNLVTSEPFYCEICQCSFTETTITAHQTSTVHLFNAKSSTKPNKLERFNISNRNRGLQLMVKQGWDKESGLGPVRNGRLYPVKTVIRNKRTGLGTEQPQARVTHFAAFDLRGIQRNVVEDRPKKRSRNDIRQEKLREWKRERRLRNELS